MGGDDATFDRKNFGCARLACSLVRFLGMRRSEAEAFVCRCARVTLDFSVWNGVAPYLTEIELYKSLQVLFVQMGGKQAANTESGSHLRALLNDLEEQFWRAYGMEITDIRTVYAVCELSLAPEAEPVGCLLRQ